jgi:multiple antibiotic resistance protein
MSYLSAALTLFLVMDPLGNVPLVATLLRKVEPTRRPRIILREHLIALGLLVAALLAGPPFLHVLGVHDHALTIGGGVVLLIIAIRMIFPSQGGVFGETGIEGEPLVVPLATPLIAGPSAMAALMMLRSQTPGSFALWFGALGTAWAASLVLLLGAAWVSRHVGQRTTAALERLMGMLLVLISIEMLLSGIADYIATLK